MNDSLANPPDSLRDPAEEPMDFSRAPSSSDGVQIVSATFAYMLSIVPDSEVEQMERLQTGEFGGRPIERWFAVTRGAIEAT